MLRGSFAAEQDRRLYYIIVWIAFGALCTALGGVRWTGDSIPLYGFTINIEHLGACFVVASLY